MGQTPSWFIVGSMENLFDVAVIGKFSFERERDFHYNLKYSLWVWSLFTVIQILDSMLMVNWKNEKYGFLWLSFVIFVLTWGQSWRRSTSGLLRDRFWALLPFEIMESLIFSLTFWPIVESEEMKIHPPRGHQTHNRQAYIQKAKIISMFILIYT